MGFTSKEMGIDCYDCNVIQMICEQDPNIANAVYKEKKSDDEMGAGDQGIMFGYATDEFDKETLHPYSHQLAN